MGFQKRPDDAEAHTGAARFAPCGEEQVEDLVPVTIRNTLAVIGN